MSIQHVALRDIVANRYRDIKNYQFSESKIEALLQSYETSGFWDGSIQARPHPTREGKYEIAFGHHRIEAAKRAKPKMDTVGLVVAQRSDADMLRMMAHENDEEYKGDALVGVETIAAVIEAYGRGEIELEPVDEGGHGGARQVFKLDFPAGKSRAYTLGTVARFLAWVKPSTGQATTRCQRAFDAYQMRATTAAALQSIPSEQRSEVAMNTVVGAATAARNAAEKAGFSPSKIRQAEAAAATEAAKEVRERSGFKVRADAAAIGHAAVSRVAHKKKPGPPPVEFYIGRLINQCKAIDPYQDILAECRRLIPFLDDLDKRQRHQLADALEGMLTRSATGVTNVARALRAQEPVKLRKLLEA